MSWASKTTLGGTLTVAGTAQQTGYITLNPGEQCHVQVKIDWPVSPVDDLIIRVQSTLDAAAEVPDTIPVWSQTVTNSSDPDYIAFIISGIYKFRIEYERDGSTDSIAVDTYYRLDGVSM